MQKIKKITFVAPKIAWGGAERVVSVLSSSLADLGYCMKEKQMNIRYQKK